jgi:DNA-directed RNA polymerase subunit RPC12/RpoP
MSWQIEHPCPQCGAPVEMEETDRIFKCEFCRTRLYISPRESFQFFIAPPRPDPDIYFLPYWRFKGMEFSCDELQVTGKIADSNILAMKLPHLPPSLGVRPQVLKLRYVAPGVPGRFITPELPFGTAAGRLSARAEGRLPDIFIGEIKSLLYSPLRVKGEWIYDAVLDRPLCPAREGLCAGLEVDETLKPPDQISFLATLCPRCGFDLEGEKDSLVLFCPNCSTSWQARDGAFESVASDFPAPLAGERPDIYLTFWSISPGIEGLKIQSQADLARLANLPRVLPGAWEKEPPCFAVPAFKVNPTLFLRLARTMTFLPKNNDRNEEVRKISLHPVTLPLNEALESLRVFIASIAHPKKSVIPHLGQMSFALKDSRLFYFPFTLRGEELIQPQIGISIQKAALFWGKLI